MEFNKCYGCTERHVSCHSECKYYINLCNVREKEKKQKRHDNLSAFMGSHSWSYTKSKR